VARHNIFCDFRWLFICLFGKVQHESSAAGVDAGQLQGDAGPHAERCICIICIGVVSVVSRYNCVYYCDTCSDTLIWYTKVLCMVKRGGIQRYGFNTEVWYR
jgi:hypothetical protein